MIDPNDASILCLLSLHPKASPKYREQVIKALSADGKKMLKDKHLQKSLAQWAQACRDSYEIGRIS